MNPYSYPDIEPVFKLEPGSNGGNYSRYKVSFPTVFVGTEENSPVTADYFESASKNDTLVILLHGVGDRSLVPCRLLARTLAGKGLACFTARLLVHSSRMPKRMATRFPALTSDEWFDIYRASVIEVRQVIDWAIRTRGTRKVALIGVSLGGFISAITMGIDERVDAGIFIVAGGNGEKINQMSRLHRLTRHYRRSDAEYEQGQQLYADYLKEVAQKGFQNVTPPRKGYLTDSLTFAHALRGRPVLMINARWDEIVPREATIDFWERSGQPQIVWYPAGHATVWAYYPAIRQKITSFLDGAFGKGG